MLLLLQILGTFIVLAAAIPMIIHAVSWIDDYFDDRERGWWGVDD